MLELGGLDVALRRRRGRARPLARGRQRRDRRPDRAERRRQVDDAARDHGPRSGARRRDPARRALAARPRARERRAARHRARARGAADLRRAHGRGEPPARPRRPPRAATAPTRTSSPSTSCSRSSRSSGAGPRARSRAASSSSSRSRRALVAAPDVLLLDEPSLGLAPKIVDVVFEALAEIRDRGIDGAARRAARAADRRLRRPHVRDRERRAAPDADARRRGRHREDGRGVPLMTRIAPARVARSPAQVLVDAIGLGAVYALMAVGIGLVFGVLRLVNFAYGQLIMAGAYTLAFASEWTGRSGRGRLLLRRRDRALARDGARRLPAAPTQSPAVMLVATFAVAFLLQSIALLRLRGQLGKPASSLALPQPAGHDRRRRHPQGHDRRHRRRRRLRSACSCSCSSGRRVGLHMRAASMDFRPRGCSASARTA